MSATIVSFFGGPGAGKSTIASSVFSRLKKQGISCEFVHEYAKELAWEAREGTLSNQTLILGKQFEMFRRCMDQVDIIITDTSLLNSAIYCHNYKLPYAREIEQLAVAMYESMDNFPFYVKRTHPYVQNGRYQTEEEADQVAMRVRASLTGLAKHPHGILEITGDNMGEEKALSAILEVAVAKEREKR